MVIVDSEDDWPLSVVSGSVSLAQTDDTMRSGECDASPVQETTYSGGSTTRKAVGQTRPGRPCSPSSGVL